MPDMTSVQLCDTQNADILAVPLTRKKLLADYCCWEASIFFPITYLGTLKFGFLLNATSPFNKMEGTQAANAFHTKL